MAIGGVYKVESPAVKALTTKPKLSKEEEEEKKKAYKNRLKTGAIAGGVVGLAGAYLAG